MWLWLCLLLFLPLVAPVPATSDDTKIEYYNQLARKNLLRKLKDFKEMHDGRLPKNIILFIGDGMGISAVTAARLYKAEKMKKTGQYSEMPFFMESFDSTGWSKTSAWDVHVTDSAVALWLVFTIGSYLVVGAIARAATKCVAKMRADK